MGDAACAEFTAVQFSLGYELLQIQGIDDTEIKVACKCTFMLALSSMWPNTSKKDCMQHFPVHTAPKKDERESRSKELY